MKLRTTFVCAGPLLPLSLSVSMIVVAVSGSAKAPADSVSVLVPGILVVIGEGPEPADFTVPSLRPYKFEYDPARISLWDSPDMQNLIPPGTPFIGPMAGGDVDQDCDVDLLDFRVLQVCFTGDGGGPLSPPCDAFDSDTDDDVDLVDFAAFQQNFSGPQCAPVPVTVFVQGLTPSSDLGDVVITLLADPQNTGVFEVQATQAVTVFDIDISPASGRAGTPITIELHPAIAPLVFDATATALWTGVYQPTKGDPSGAFSFIFSQDQLHEQSPSEAVLIAGDGTLVGDIPTLEQLARTEGTVVGEVTVVLGAGKFDMARTYVFTPAPESRFLRLAYDPENPDDPATFGSELGEIEIVFISDPLNPPFLPGIRVGHFALEVCLDDNDFTRGSPPPVLTVDIATTDIDGSVLDSAENVTLNPSSEKLPGCLLYRSDPATPLIVISESIDENIFPDLIILRGADDGAVVAVPGGTP